MCADYASRPIFISFSGIDGAGKSTQIELLRARFIDAGLRVKLISFWNDVARLTSLREISGHTLLKGDKGVGSPERPINRRDKNVQSGMMTAARLCFYLLDAVSLRLQVRKALSSGSDLIIFDRYIYDEVANLALHQPAVRFYVRLIMKIVPRPHVSYVLDADPVQARARKPEYPLEFLYQNRASFLALSELAGMTVIPPSPVEEMHRRIMMYLPGADAPVRAVKKSGERIAASENDPETPTPLDGHDAHPAAL